MTTADRRTWIAWGVLVAATLCSIEIFRAAGLGVPRQSAGVAVLVIAFVKVRIVATEFMEIRHGPRAFRIAFDLWLVGLGAILLWLYLDQAA